MSMRIWSHGVLAAAAVLGLAACGGSPSQPAQPSVSPAPAPQTVELAPEPPAAEPARPMRWDFSRGPAVASQWTYEDLEPQTHSDGVLVTVHRQSGPLAIKRTMRLDTGDFAAVQVRAKLEDGTPLRRVRLFWARDIEVQRRGYGWPFSEERVVQLRQDADDPTLWRGQLAPHHLWNGEVEGVFVEFALPEGALAAGESLEVILGEVMLIPHGQG